MTWRRHVHVNRGVLRRTMAHSNYIEGLWGVLKDKVRRNYVTIPASDNLEDFLNEAMFRYRLTQMRDEEERRNYIRHIYRQM